MSAARNFQFKYSSALHAACVSPAKRSVFCVVCPNIRTQLDLCVIANKKRNKNPRHILCQFKPAAEAYVISLWAEEIAAAAQTAARRLRNKSRCMHLKYI
jgi:hypothetical protein